MLAHLLALVVNPSTASPAPESFSSLLYVLLCAAGLPTDTCGHEEQHTTRERVRSCGATNASRRCCFGVCRSPEAYPHQMGRCRVVKCGRLHGHAWGWAWSCADRAAATAAHSRTALTLTMLTSVGGSGGGDGGGGCKWAD